MKNYRNMNDNDNSSPKQKRKKSNGGNNHDINDHTPRIGEEYQAIIPNLLSQSERNSDEYLHKDYCPWSPPATLELDDQQVDTYIKYAKDEHGYSREQALGQLYWHNYNVENAKADLGNFMPVIENVTIHSDTDREIFGQALTWHGKNFGCIEKHAMVGKSLKAIIEYYYLEKHKTLKKKKKKKTRKERKECGLR